MNFTKSEIETLLKRKYGGSWKVEPEYLDGQIDTGESLNVFYFGRLNFSGAQSWAPSVVGRTNLIDETNINDWGHQMNDVLSPVGEYAYRVATSEEVVYVQIAYNLPVVKSYIRGAFMRANEVDDYRMFVYEPGTQHKEVNNGMLESSGDVDDWYVEDFGNDWYLVQQRFTPTLAELPNGRFRMYAYGQVNQAYFDFGSVHVYEGSEFGYKAQPKDLTPRMSLSAQVGGKSLPMDSQTVFTKTLKDLSGYASFIGYRCEKI